MNPPFLDPNNISLQEWNSLSLLAQRLYSLWGFIWRGGHWEFNLLHWKQIVLWREKNVGMWFVGVSIWPWVRGAHQRPVRYYHFGAELHPGSLPALTLRRERYVPPGYQAFHITVNV